MLEPLQMQVIWASSFLVLLVLFLYIVKTEGRRYFFYFLSGSLLGLFVFDLPSTLSGYYAMNTSAYEYMMLGLIPPSMTIMEGFSIMLSIYVFEKILKALRKR
jgi:hypothetical protein